jgi:cytochrome b561
MRSGIARASDYDPVVRRVHWLAAILVAIAIALAWGITGAPRHGGIRDRLIELHGSVGLVILVLMLFWTGWRLRHKSPPLRPLLSGLEVLLARATHAALLALFVAMPLTGYIALTAAGRAVTWFGVIPIPTLVPENPSMARAAMALHLIGEFLIYGLVALHVSAALMHGFLRRDGILDRMLPRRGA